MAAIYSSSIKKQRCLTHEYCEAEGGENEKQVRRCNTRFLSSNVTVCIFFFFHFHETDVKRNHLVVAVF
jgi:hypothetical protein